MTIQVKPIYQAPNTSNSDFTTYSINIEAPTGISYDSVAILNIPAGVELNAGHMLPNGVWVLLPNQLSNLEMHVPQNIANNTKIDSDINIMHIQDGNPQNIDQINLSEILDLTKEVTPNNENNLDQNNPSTEIFENNNFFDNSISSLNNTDFLDYELNTSSQLTFHEMLGEPDNFTDQISDEVIIGDDMSLIDNNSLFSLYSSTENTAYPWESQIQANGTTENLDNSLFIDQLDSSGLGDAWGSDPQPHYTRKDITEAQDLIANNDEIISDTESNILEAERVDSF